MAEVVKLPYSAEQIAERLKKTDNIKTNEQIAKLLDTYVNSHKAELAGKDGQDGVNGKDGIDGTTPTFTVGTISTVTDTEQASVEITEVDNGKYELNFSIPRGAKGDKGDTVINDGGSSAVTIETPTLSIGTVTTLENGSSATASLVADGNNYKLNIGIPKGENGIGEDGYSPTVNVVEEQNGHKVFISDKEGSRSFVVTDGKDGVDGKNGKDGISPTVTVSKNDKATTVTITDATGEHSFVVNDGVDGTNTSVTDEQIANAVNSYLVEHPVETVSQEDITNVVKTYLAENPVSGGVSQEQLQTGIAEYMTDNPVTNIDEKSFKKNANEWIENIRFAGGNLPVVFLEGDITGISKENPVDIKVTFTSQFKTFTETGTLKWQGNSSLSYPKKNFTLKMDKKHGVGWGKTKKYCLKANYIDHSHARNIVSARLWSQVVQSRADYDTLPEELRTSPNNGAIDGFPIRVYLNDSYQGLYTWNVPKGSFMFNMDDKNDKHSVLCGENYDSGLFRAVARIDGTDWSEQIHDIVPQSITTRWNEVINFVMNSTDEDFKAHIDEYVDLQSLIDYYIFAYVSTGLDALGKNQLYATYDGQKWYATMYDMDSTWGMYYTGQKFVSDKYKMQDEYESKVQGRKGNLLYYRLENLFRTEIQNRYDVLRSSILSYSNILGAFESFMSCITSQQYTEDGTIYSGIPSTLSNNIKQIRSYVKARLNYVDSMLIDVLIEKISIQSIKGYENTNKLVSVTTEPPNANNYNFTYNIDDTNIATVDEKGTISLKTAGTCNLTVTDTISGVSATSTITVNEKIISDDDSEKVTSCNKLYELEEEKVFNGVSDYIDTGLKLMNTNTDWSIYINFESPNPNMQDYDNTLATCMIETSPYNGFVIRNLNSMYGIGSGAAVQTPLGLSTKTDNIHKLIITHAKESNRVTVYVDGVEKTVTRDNVLSNNGNLLIGVSYKDGMNIGQRFFKGTIYEFNVYDGIVTNDEMDSLFEMPPVTSISISDMSGKKGRILRNIKVTTEPSGVPVNMSYTSDDENIVSTIDGNITCVSVGETTITGTDSISGLKTKFKVKVDKSIVADMVTQYPELNELYLNNEDIAERYPYIIYYLSYNNASRILLGISERDVANTYITGAIGYNCMLYYANKDFTEFENDVKQLGWYDIEKNEVNIVKPLRKIDVRKDGANNDIAYYNQGIIQGGITTPRQIGETKFLLSSVDIYGCTSFNADTQKLVPEEIVFEANC